MSSKSQADRVLTKFGGPSRFAKLCAEIGEPIAPSTVYRWVYPRKSPSRGQDGLIPSTRWALVKRVAAYDGVVLEEGDYDPNPR